MFILKVKYLECYDILLFICMSMYEESHTYRKQFRIIKICSLQFLINLGVQSKFPV